MPRAVDRRDGTGTRLRSDERAAGERYDVLAGGGAVADEALRDQDAVTVTDAEDASTGGTYSAMPARLQRRSLIKGQAAMISVEALSVSGYEGSPEPKQSLRAG